MALNVSEGGALRGEASHAARALALTNFRRGRYFVTISLLLDGAAIPPLTYISEMKPQSERNIQSGKTDRVPIESFRCAIIWVRVSYGWGFNRPYRSSFELTLQGKIS